MFEGVRFEDCVSSLEQYFSSGREFCTLGNILQNQEVFLNVTRMSDGAVLLAPSEGAGKHPTMHKTALPA